jgi:hypothetical protein
MQKPKIDLLVLSITSPILIGLYENEKLVKDFSYDGKTSDILPLAFEQLTCEYDINAIFYVNGPGSFMAIKISYIFLKTFCITNDIELFATSGFTFNQNSPIKALGKKYFFNNKDGKISLNNLDEDTKIYPFELPKKLEKEVFSTNNEPNYNLPAVN